MGNLSEFENYLAEEEKSRLTKEKYMRDVRKFLQWMDDRTVTKAEVLAYKSWLLDRYAIVSVNSMLSSLNTYLSYRGLENCKVKTVKIQREVFCAAEKELTKREYERLLSAAKDDLRLYLLMQTICSTGIRVSEHQFITVEAIVQGKATVRCKGKVRTVLLPRKLCKALAAYARRCGIKSGSIFITKTGRPLDRSRVWALMKKLCRTAKVQAEKVFPHNLRHLFAHVYYSIEKDIIRLADILGHASVNTTRIYMRESGDIHRKQIEKMSLLAIT